MIKKDRKKKGQKEILYIVRSALLFLYIFPTATIEQFQFEINFPPTQSPLSLVCLSLVIYSTNSTVTIQGQQINLFVQCENTPGMNHINSYIFSEKEWQENFFNLSSIPCSDSEKWDFFVQLENKNLNDSVYTMLVAYSYSLFGGFEATFDAAIQKRSSEASHRTTLHEIAETGSACTVHSIYLSFDELQLLPETETVYSPDPYGINLTFCYGLCTQSLCHRPLCRQSPCPTPSWQHTMCTPTNNIFNITRDHLFTLIAQDPNNSLPGPKCIPDEIENQELRSINKFDMVKVYLFPTVKSCKCSF